VREPGRWLRIGYVPADYRDHCQSPLTVPVFAHHGCAQYKIARYSSVERPDALTRRL
jgi:predicted O-linked N-acetylglucosamine transferase (SPINDLY family)